jgi:hypothetical protein
MQRQSHVSQKPRFGCQFSIPETARSGEPQIHLVITMLARTDLVDAQFLQQNQPLRVYVIIDIFIIFTLFLCNSCDNIAAESEKSWLQGGRGGPTF